jgi:regulator of cell morphogenesis and NO signaling
MDINGTTRVGDIAARIPASIEVFERYGVDFCCNGGRPLTEALAGTGASVGGIMAEIERVVDLEREQERQHVDWIHESLATLADHIVETHHTFLKREMPRVDRDLARVISVHGAHHPELIELGREQVFPLLRGLGPSDSASPELLGLLEQLEAEHDGAGSALRAIRGMTSNYQTPPDACFIYSTLYQELQALEADVHRHVHLENNVLIPGLRARAC